MKTYLIERSAVAAATLTIPTVAIAWLTLVPGMMSPGTFVAAAAVAIGAGAVGLRTWRSGQATGTIGQVIHDAEAARKVERQTTAGRLGRDA
jgi:hypothetical protein